MLADHALVRRQSLSEIRNINVNLQWLKTRGLDIEAAYNLPLSGFSELPGAFNFRLLATHTFENKTNLFGTVTDRVGETGGALGSPDWLASLVVGYDERRIPGQCDDALHQQRRAQCLVYGPD